MKRGGWHVIIDNGSVSLCGVFDPIWAMRDTRYFRDLKVFDCCSDCWGWVYGPTDGSYPHDVVEG